MVRPYMYQHPLGVTILLFSSKYPFAIIGTYVSFFIFMHLLFLYVHVRNSGLEVEYYRHFKPETCGFDAEACYEDLRVSIT